jgi:dipeptidyl aminopeptidase/acylaminoacyl peptidase
MKSKNLIMGLVCVLILVVVVSITTKSQKPEETPLFEPILIGTGGDPHWSPDGSKLAYVYKNALYIANADGTGERLKVAELPKQTWGFVWADSAEFIFWEYERKRIEGKGWEKTKRIKKLTIDGTIEPIVEAQTSKGDRLISLPMVLNDGTVGYYEVPGPEAKTLKALEEEKTFRIIGSGKLPPDSALKQMTAIPHYELPSLKRQGILDSDKGIWLESVDGTMKRQICKDKSYAYMSPQLSPDGRKILAQNPYGHGIWVLDLDGKESAYLGGGLEDTLELAPGKFGRAVGVTAKWSPDSERIVYMVSAEDGEIGVITTDLFLINADGTGRVSLTNTPDIIEASPIWSPDGTRIAYVTDIGSKIYVVKVK